MWAIVPSIEWKLMPASRVRSSGRTSRTALSIWRSAQSMYRSSSRTTDAGADISEDRRLLVGAEDLAQGVADLAHRAVGLHAIEDQRHGVVAAGGAPPEGVERPRHGAGVPPRLDLVDERDLPLAQIVRNVEDLDRLL